MNVDVDIECQNEVVSEKRKVGLVLNTLKDFTSNTSLHGLKYISERRVTWLERVFWLLTFLVSIVLCFLLILNVWNKWQTSPVIVSFSEQMIPVWQVPFPSVTICPQLKSRASVFNYTKLIKKYMESLFTEDMLHGWEKMDNVAMVCDQEDSIPFTTREFCNSSTINDIVEVAPKISDIIDSCKWRDVSWECEKFMNKVLTSEGVCYDFNGLSANEMFQDDSIQTDYQYINQTKQVKSWSTESGYTEESSEPYPFRGRENGAKPDLDIILKEFIEDRDGMCNALNHGFKIYLHHPMDMPRSKMYYYAVLSPQVTSLAVNFRMITTSKNLKSYAPAIRQCYFPSDRKLRYFKHYTQSNCELECRSNYTFLECGCVWYNMPHNDSEQICCNVKENCVNEAKEKLADREMRLALEANAGNHSEKGCRCLPACDTVQYDAEVLKSDFDYATYYKTFEKLLSNETEKVTYQYSRLLVFFKDAQFASMSRSELFGLTDFLANCGGLLGLFLGFSFLSLVEIIYFSSLRLCCVIRRERLTHDGTKNKKNMSEYEKGLSDNKKQ